MYRTLFRVPFCLLKEGWAGPLIGSYFVQSQWERGSGAPPELKKKNHEHFALKGFPAAVYVSGAVLGQLKKL